MDNRPSIIAGNWKMYKTSSEAAAFIKTLAPLLVNSQLSIFIAPPFTALAKMADVTKECSCPISLGGQNMHFKQEGPYTGEISAPMLKSEGATFVLLGHSERRSHFKESSPFINQKVHAALKNDLIPLVCIGESLEERENGVTQEVLQKQLEGSLANLSTEEMKKVILAYEPVWAIGTGAVAHPDDAEKAHRFCREVVAEKWGSESAKSLPILYGGSVKGSNAYSLMEKDDVDGLLVGGASLSPQSFSEIIDTVKLSHY